MEKLEYAMDNLDNSVDDSEEILGIVDDTADVVAYRVLAVGQDSETSNLTQTNRIATNLTPCQYYVISNANEFVQTQRNITPRTDNNNTRNAPLSNIKKRDERRRATHNEVERRRRDKINTWIMKLGTIIPSENNDTVVGSNRLNSTNNVNNCEGHSKGGILAKACEYITELKEINGSLKECLKENVQILDENKRLCESNERLRHENELLKAHITKHGIVPPPEICIQKLEES